MENILKNEIRFIIQHLDTNEAQYTSSSVIANIVGVSSKTSNSYLKITI